ncbi:hypothetical protein LOD99_3888 [Oopsacas minuta]|uniref:Uncharacterized protein n=1 Tax=Oopsacas minuta TaxID=111878 RepID=A0AAV7JW55_9METZ|nr:hypothetical protein LOD99_3888 [Oopsacas minuta]
MLALRIAQDKAPNTTAEELMLPCGKHIVRCLIGNEGEKKICYVSLSNDIVYIKDGYFKEEFLFCHCLESTTRGEDVFIQVSEYFERRRLSWNNVTACTTDEAPAMLGNRSGFRTQVKAVNHGTKHIHCLIHLYALASKTLPSELKATLDDVINMVNFIKSSALNTRLFRLLCQEFDDEQNMLLFYTEVRWLSRGNMLSRVHFLRKEMAEFFERSERAKSRVFATSCKIKHGLLDSLT